MKRWYKVKVYFPEWDLGLLGTMPPEIHEDEILGETPLDAVKNAMYNWKHAEWIELV